MKFTIYSREGCPYCEKIQDVMEMIDANFIVYKLERDFTRTQFYAEFGEGSTFPQIILNDEKHLGGCTDTVQFLREQNLI